MDEELDPVRPDGCRNQVDFKRKKKPPWGQGSPGGGGEQVKSPGNQRNVDNFST